MRRLPLSIGSRGLRASIACLIVAACQPAGLEREQLREAVDRLEISELLNRHQIYIDAEDPERWASLYTSDGSYESPFGTASDVEQLTQMSRSLLEAEFTKGKRHLTGPAMIDISGDRAYALSYYWVAETANFPPVIVSTGRYCDEFRRENGQWRIARRVQSIDPNWLLRDEMESGVTAATLEAHGNRACPAQPVDRSLRSNSLGMASKLPSAPASH